MSTVADNALTASARLWFAVTVAGQLILAAYVALFYGGTALQGQVEAWNRVLTRGYVRGDAPGNLALVAHLLAAVMLTVGGALQLIPRLRERFPALHRRAGRIYVLTAVALSLTGLYLTWIRGTRGDLGQHIGGTFNAILIIVSAVLVVRTAMAGRFAAHRVWALRLFVIVSGAWFYRVGLFLWLLINRGPVGFDVETFQGPTLTFLSWANTLVPLTVLELYLRARTSPSRIAMATVLFVLTVAMAIGIFSATMTMWLPLVRTGELSSMLR